MNIVNYVKGIFGSNQKIIPIRSTHVIDYFDFYKKINADSDKQYEPRINTIILYENIIYFSYTIEILTKFMGGWIKKYETIIGNWDPVNKKYTEIIKISMPADFKIINGYFFVHTCYNYIDKFDKNGNKLDTYTTNDIIQDIIGIESTGQSTDIESKKSICVIGSNSMYEFDNDLNLLSSQTYFGSLYGKQGFYYEKKLYVLVGQKYGAPISILNINRPFEWSGEYEIAQIIGFDHYIYARTECNKIIKWTHNGRNPKIIAKYTEICDISSDANYLYCVTSNQKKSSCNQMLITIIKFDKNNNQLEKIVYDTFKNITIPSMINFDCICVSVSVSGDSFERKYATPIAQMIKPRYIIASNNMFYVAEHNGIRILKENKFSITMVRGDFLIQHQTMQYTIVYMKWFQKQIKIRYKIVIPNDIIEFILHLL